MSPIRLPGLMTGIDTNALIAQLMAIQRYTLNRYRDRQSLWEEKKDALNTLETKLSTLRTTLRDLSDADELRAFSVSSSDSDYLTADASYNAFEGSHTVVINQLANAERWVHTTGLKYSEDFVGEGTFIYSYNHKETVLTTTATTTLEDFVGLINEDANNPGVTASLLRYNDAYHLVLNGDEAGTDYTISINASSTEVWKPDTEQPDHTFTVNTDNATLATKITDLDQFMGSLGTGDKITITGKDHSGVAITPVELTVTSNTKLTHLISEINDAFDGVAKATLVNGKIYLTDDLDEASGLEIGLSFTQGTGSSAELGLPTMAVETEGGSTVANLGGFDSEADDWGGAPTQLAQDSQIRVDGYPSGDWISRSSNTVDDVIYGVALHLHDTTDANGQQITLTRDVDAVKEKLKSMISAYNLAVNYIKDKTEYDAEAETAGVLIGDYLITNMMSQLCEPLISQTSGFIVDIDTFLTPGQIGLELDSDGLLNLDTNVFDEAIAEDYLGVLAIIGADKTGSSTSDVVEFYGASSRYTTADEYNVKITVSGGNITEAKIKLSTESTYRDMTFTAGSNVITGNSTFNDDGDPVYPENGLQLSVDLVNGTYGTDENPIVVRVKQGFTGAIEDVIDTTLRTATGPLQISQKYADNTIDALEDRIEDELDRLEVREDRLIEKFAKLESTLAILQNQMAGLFGFGLL